MLPFCHFWVFTFWISATSRLTGQFFLTVKTTTVADVRLVVMNVLSLGNKLDCVIDHITDNILDIVGITETWLLNDDINNMLVVNTYLDRNTGRRGGGVEVLINNQINVNSRVIGVNP